MRVQLRPRTSPLKSAGIIAADAAASGISGLLPANDPVNYNTHLVIAPGVARDSAQGARVNVKNIVLSTGMTKRLDMAWTAGSGNGGLDTGTVAAAADYHIFVIRNPSTGAVDVLFGASPTNPVMPSGYTQKRRIGSVLTGSGGAINQGTWYANGDFQFKTPFAYQATAADPSGTGAAVSSVSTLVTLRMPKGIKVKADILYNFFNNTAATGWLGIYDPDVRVPPANLAADSTLPFAAVVLRSGQPWGVRHRCWTNRAGQVYVNDSGGGDGLVLCYHNGWFDPRDEFAT
jgi:hypothetical protein